MATGRRGIAFALAGCLALAGTAAPAAAKTKQASPGKVKTATATANTAAPSQVVNLIATCPKGTTVVGGGFSAGFAGTPLSDANVVTESRRSGKKAWSVTAQRADTGSAGPSLPVTAEAYCRSGAGKISESVATQPADVSLTIYTPTATCSRAKTELGGGFAFAITPNNNFPVVLHENAPFGGVGWSVGATGQSPTFVSSAAAFAYCQARDKALPQRVGIGALAPASGVPASVDTAPCSGKRTAIGGGFAGAKLVSPGPLPGYQESRRVEKGWRVTALNLSGGNTGPFTAFALCD